MPAFKLTSGGLIFGKELKYRIYQISGRSSNLSAEDF